MTDKNFKKVSLPDKPGVYFFLGPPKHGEGGKKGKDILYIGKATSIRDRVKSYFGKDLIETRGPILVDMIFNADKIDFQITDSVLEAFILEANLIKKYQPKYNTKEKSDKSFLCVVITKEEIPQVLTIRARNLEGHSDILKNLRISKIYGPFTNGVQLREAMKIVRRIFPYIDAQSSKRNNFEFYRQLGLTPDTSSGEFQLAYKKNIVNLKLFFEGKKKKIIFNLKKEMLHYAKNKEFEHANEIKKRIFSLQHINDMALLKQESSFQNGLAGVGDPENRGPYEKKIPVSVFRIEAYDIAHMGGKNMVGVMTVLENREPVKNEYRKFKIRTQSNANDTGALKEVLERRIAHKEWTYPNLIVVDGGTAQINVTQRAMSRFNLDIPIVSVVKDERHKPMNIKGDKKYIHQYEREILLANSEAHRFAIAYHKNMRNKNFLK